MKFRLLATLFLVSHIYAAPAPNVLMESAEYYFSRGDYEQALVAWEELRKQSPMALLPVRRICEIQIIQKGRETCRDTLNGFVRRYWSHLNLEQQFAIKKQ
jgi:hypothetical protein